MLRPDLPEEWNFDREGTGIPFCSRLSPIEMERRAAEEHSLMAALKKDSPTSLTEGISARGNCWSSI